MKEQEFLHKLEYIEQIYFSNDEPVPLKEGLKIHPVKLKDYYKFYNLIGCFTVDKNIDIENMGISKSHLTYALLLVEKDRPGFGNRFLELLGMVFGIKNNIICGNKDCDLEEQDLIAFYSKLFSLQKEYETAPFERKVEIEQEVEMLCACPKCNSPLREKISIMQEDKKKHLFVGHTEITKDDYDFLRRVYCYQNILDYDDRYIDPELKEALDEKKRLESMDAENPTLEKQEAAVITGSPYTFETIKEVSLRKFTMLLRVIEARLQYEAMRSGEMSGMVTFKNPIQHWLYSNNKKKSIMDEVTSLDSFKNKFQENGNAAVK